MCSMYITNMGKCSAFKMIVSHKSRNITPHFQFVYFVEMKNDSNIEQRMTNIGWGGESVTRSYLIYILYIVCPLCVCV